MSRTSAPTWVLSGRQLLVQAADDVERQSLVAERRPRTQQRYPLGGRQRQESAALLGSGSHDLLPVECRSGYRHYRLCRQHRTGVHSGRLAGAQQEGR